MDVEELLGPDGPLAKHLTGFAARPQQQRMAQTVTQALQENRVLVAEAGTGTGKTFAYLLPALLSGLKILISTGTRNLQDQLFYKDLPIVREALAVPVNTALLKGRANYLCLHRLHNTATEGRLSSRAQVAQLVIVQDWSGRTRQGDISEVSDVPEDSPLWSKITSTIDNCLGQECNYFQDCYVMKARRRAIEADVIVINHHLFCADMVLKEEGVGELLPAVDAFVIDEAHQLPDIASQFFGLSLSSYQISELARDTFIEQQRDAPDFIALVERTQNLEKAGAEMRLELGMANRREPWLRVANNPQINTAAANLQQALEQLLEALEEAAVRGKGLASCLQRGKSQLDKLQCFLTVQDEHNVRWFETRNRGFTFSLTPLDISKDFATYMKQRPASWVFTSATLAVGEEFTHFNQRLGLENPATLQVASPFDFAHNAMLYHPKDMPEPNSAHYTDALLNNCLPVLAASRGRAFMLFTSYQALQEMAQLLEHQIDYPLLVQGSLPKQQLLERFRQLGNAVLLGTSSFWEGVDVRGEALSCVIIAKLPFAAPNDPVLQARIEALRRRGENPFIDYQLPQAVITLKQGVGRLIRDVNDRGVLMLCDPRLLTKHYGRIFLDSLPPMPRTRHLHRVEKFFASEKNF